MPRRNRCLELFKGTGSVGGVCEELGYDVVSLDINARYNATYCCDILDFDYKAFMLLLGTFIRGQGPCNRTLTPTGLPGLRLPYNLHYHDRVALQ